MAVGTMPALWLIKQVLFSVFLSDCSELRLMKKADLCDNKEERELSHHKAEKDRGKKLHSS